MPVAQSITKAYVLPISWSDDGAVQPGPDADKLYVQFNPTSLRVTYANQKAGGDQPGTSPVQFVGKGTTKLAVELLFDVTGPMPDGSTLADVRELTQRVAKFLEPKEDGENEQGQPQYVPPGIRFGWDTFVFDGVVDSMDETLDFFSSAGKPLRATVSLQITKQEIKVDAVSGSPGTSPQHLVQDDETLQQAAGAGWQGIGLANGIENPRMLTAGALVDLNVSVSAGVTAGVSVSASAGASFGAGASGGFSVGTANTLSTGVATGLGFGASSRVGASVPGVGLGASASVTGPSATVSAPGLSFGTKPR